MRLFIRKFIIVTALIFGVIVVLFGNISPFQIPAISIFNNSLLLQDTTISANGDTIIRDNQGNIIYSSIKGEDDLIYPYIQDENNPYDEGVNSPMYMKDPDNFSSDVEYNTETNEYSITNKVGENNIGSPRTMSLNEYIDYDFDKSMKDYWEQRRNAENFGGRTGAIPKLYINSEVFDRIFGGNTIDIKPQGSATLIFGLNTSKTENPTLPKKQQKSTTFDFDEQIQMNVQGQIGDKMKVSVIYNTEATFDYENSVKIEYQGYDDEIIQKIEAGNVSLPLSGSLITGSQSLFGFKTELKFGKLTVTTLFSQQKSETSVIEVEGGAQTTRYEVTADDYEANKHYFLNHFFEANYNYALSKLPIIQSGVNISKIEVWVTNKRNDFENSRNIIAFLDLAESDSLQNPNLNRNISEEYPYPYDSINRLTDIVDFNQIRDINTANSYLATLPNMEGGVNFEKIESARKLNQSEYKYNSKLGYISLNSALNSDEVLAVAYEYTIAGDPKIYKVGELSTSGISAPEALVVKLIKGTNFTPKLINWGLMMKNVYAIGAYQVSPEDFKLDVVYNNPQIGTPVKFLSEGDIKDEILISALGLDKLNSQSDPYPDGVFDFIDGITINSSNGRIYFPVLEPFGRDLQQLITGGDVTKNEIADRYCFFELYDSTQSMARQIAEKNKFSLEGSYKSAGGSDISLNAFNVPQGSVKVTAGGTPLVENQDYTVDYTLGRVKIINTGLLESGTPIQISTENNSLFSIQSKTLMGTHFNYEVNKDFNIGGTILNLTERPLTQKVSIGDEPISNTIWGIDGLYRKELPIITKIIDKLPFLETKAKSTLTAQGEFAHLIPGHSKAIGSEGTSYIDDFEGAKTSIDIKTYSAWVLASTPQKQESTLFKEGALNNDLAYGFNRARFSWYVINPDFLRMNSATPDHIKNNLDSRSSHLVREIDESELFPNKESQTGLPTNLVVLNIDFDPTERGPYNYDANVSAYSKGVDANGKLNDPQTRWGGIMRKIDVNDFEASNIEYVEFWLMDPFVEDATNNGGDLYFNLGNISEDILKDSRKSFENGLPYNQDNTYVDTTIWGRVPLSQSLVSTFNDGDEPRLMQDVGYDGLSDDNERNFFDTTYIAKIKALYGQGSQAYIKATSDPSSDNFHFFKGTDYDNAQLGILDRYKAFNGVEGNSPTANQYTETYGTSATNVPDAEDINKDNTLSEFESYYQYKVSLKPQDLVVGTNYITDKIDYTANFENGDKSPVSWYQFKIPISEYQNKFGDIQDFKSIRFMRLFMKGFEKRTVLRIATMDLVRGEWRKYKYSLTEASENIPNDDNNTIFDITAVNIEENSGKTPINYILPPGIDRVVSPSDPQLRQLNEQAISMKVIDLKDGDARAAYKNIDMDIRQYKRLKMFVHAEAISGSSLSNDDLSVFVRIGSDFKNNYYEYEIPLSVTSPKFYDNNSEDDRKIVWPEENEINLALNDLLIAKQSRNDAMNSTGSTVSYSTPYYYKLEGIKRIKIMGNPNMSDVRTIMIGIRNRKDDNLAGREDDGFAKSAEIWMNELRLGDFDEKGGWAANARITLKLADFGNVNFAGGTVKPGFGSIEKKVSERSKEESFNYDIASTFELGKFFPEAAGVRIPMYLGVSERWSNPQYNPLDPDVPFEVALNDPTKTKDEIQEIKEQGQIRMKMKSFNFSNVRINKKAGKAKPQIYDVSNWSVSYAYRESMARDINTIRNNRIEHSGGLNYDFNATPKNVEPLKNAKALKSKHLKLIKDFNFYYAPSQISFRTTLNKSYVESQLRNLDNPTDHRYDIDPTYNKDFSWIRQYDFKYDLSKSIKLDFSATNTARINEPEGKIDKNQDYEYKLYKEAVYSSLQDYGRTTNYNHRANINWKVPINSIPLLNWITVSLRYGATFDWSAGPIVLDTADNIGNTIKNTNTYQINGQFNLLNLYNKVPYLNEINKALKRKGKPQKKKTKKVQMPSATIELKKDVPKIIFHKLKTEEVDIKVFDSAGKQLIVTTEILNKNKISITTDKDLAKARVEITGTVDLEESLFKKIADQTLYLAMSVKNVNISYSENNGTLLPGYMQKSKFVGLNNTNGMIQPGVPFVFGEQKTNFGVYEGSGNFLSTNEMLNTTYSMTHTSTFNIRSSIEPFDDFRIDLTFNRGFSENTNSYITMDSTSRVWKYSNSIQSGNYTSTFWSWRTAFEKFGGDGKWGSEAFNTFLENRKTISQRLGEENNIPANGEEYADGYGEYSQDVLIASFKSAYSGISPKLVTLVEFPTMMLPNWRATYNGLSKIEFLKTYLKKVNLSHGYRSTYNVGSYVTNLDYSASDVIRDLNNNFISEHEITGVTISEQFSPLISIDMTWVNSLLSKIEVKKSRNLSMSLSNNQISEVKGNEYIIGAGYRFPQVPIDISSILPNAPTKQFKSDLNVRADLSFRKDVTIIHKFDAGNGNASNDPTSGQKNISVILNVDYKLGASFTVVLFYERSVLDPFISTTYKRSDSKFGVKLTFMLAG